jgi:hypothetical protein
MAFYWEDLLEDLVQRRKVVAVIGADLLGVAKPGGSVPFYDALAARTAARLGAAGIQGLPPDADWAALQAAIGERRFHKGQFARELSVSHNELLAEQTAAMLPEPLRLLGEITDFRLVLTTTIDGLAGKAMGVPEGSALISNFTRNADLPPGWQATQGGAVRSPPTLVHLFGRINSYGNYALTEEDLLEFMCNLQGKNQPTELLARLRRSDVLMLGTRFPDWLARFFLRLVRGDRLSQENQNTSREEAFEAVLADTEAQSPRPLVAFLKTYSPLTRIYEEGSAADFVKELHQRWTRLRPSPGQSPVVVAPGPAYAAAQPPPPPSSDKFIFVSYVGEDRAAAVAVVEALERANLSVWFDKNRGPGLGLEHGTDYDFEINKKIRECTLFVLLLSRNTLKQEVSYFRNEWRWASQRWRITQIGRPFMKPVVIDDLEYAKSPDFWEFCELRGERKCNVLKAPGGLLEKVVLRTADDGTETAVESFIRDIRAAQMSLPGVAVGQ